MAFDEKNIDSKKPSDNNPFLGLLIKSCRKLMSTALSFSPGITSFISPYISSWNRWVMGKNGINVKRKIMAGGIAMTKLNAIAEALSVIPIVLTCPKKNLITSYKGMPRNPGKDVSLLFLSINTAGADERSLFLIFFITRAFILLYSQNPFFLSVPADTILHISNGR